ncbi:MAG: sensor domain-containing diguanylate cyclase [Candidatus Eisenbacteria bacterium]
MKLKATTPVKRRATARPARASKAAPRRSDGGAAALRHLDLAAKSLGWTSVERDRNRRALEAALAEGDAAWQAFSERLLAWSRQALEEGPAVATTQRLAALAEVVAIVRESPDPADALGRALDRLQQAVAFENATLFLLDEEKGALIPVATRGERVDLIPDVQFDLGHGLSSWVARSGRPVLLSDLRGDGREGREGPSRPGSFLSVPLIDQRQVIGVLNAGSCRPGAFTEADRDLLVAAGAALAAPLVARRVTEAADRLPGTDPLTGLANAPAFTARLNEAIERGRRYGEACTVIVVTPERFPGFHAAFGKDAAEATLVELGGLIAGRARKSDVVARLAPGPSFAILLAHQTPERARLVLERLVGAVARHSFPQRRHIALQAGLATWPLDGDSAARLLAAATPTPTPSIAAIEAEAA